MSQITIELLDSTYRKAREIAKRTGKTMENVLSDWVNRLVDDAPIDLLSDEEVLTLADAVMPQQQQDEMNTLLVLSREGRISSHEQSRLDELMAIYRHGLVRKAHAMKAVVERGLRSQNLDDWPDLDE